MTHRVFDGPHGLTAIDHLRTRGFHGPQGKLWVEDFFPERMLRILIVKDADGDSWVDAYWNPKHGTKEEAEKWLLDWCMVVYGGEG